MTITMPRPIDDTPLELRQLTFDDTTREVYCLGTGPAVVVMHEIPDLHPGVVEFGRIVAGAGFRVYMPSLIGTPFVPMTVGSSLRSIARACVSREFATWATGKTSPITVWLRALARLAFEECGGLGVGAVGMCLSGGFALAMMVEDCVTAPVLSQPSLPFPISRARKRDLGIDAATLDRVRERAAAGTCVLGLRFTRDWMSPGERFARLREELGDNFLAVEIDSGPGNLHGISRRAHSVLAIDRVDTPGHPTDDALERVLGFFRERLTPSPSPS